MSLRKHIRNILEEAFDDSKKNNKKSLKNILDSNIAYDILDSSEAGGSMWTQGGCAILAFALNKAYGYPVYVIFDNDLNQIDHFVVKMPNGNYLDYRGEHKDLISDFKEDEGLWKKDLTILPYSKKIRNNGIVIDDIASEKLASLIMKRNISESEVNSTIQYPHNEHEKGIKIYGYYDPNNKRAKLSSIEIIPSKRKEGLGKKYVSEFERWAKELGAKYIDIDAYKKSVGFWDKMGYELEKTFPVYSGNKQDYKFGSKEINEEEENIDKNILEYKIENLGYHHGQSDMELGLYLDGEIVGMVQYVLFDGELTVSDILVRPEFRRKGYGSRMMKYIQKEHPEYKYIPSMKTDLGSKFVHKDISIDEVRKIVREILREVVFENESKFSDDYDFSKHSFTTGDCDIYAVSLHRLYGYPLYVVRGWFDDGMEKFDDVEDEDDFNFEDSHIVVKLPNGNYMDSYGETTEAELRQNSAFSNDIYKITIEPIDEETALNTFSCQDQEADVQKVMQYIKTKNVIKENENNPPSNILDPQLYLDDFYAMDFNNEKNEHQALEIIQKVIDQVINFQYPMTVYRGIDTNPRKGENYDNSSWSRKKEVAKGFGDKLFMGIIPNENVIDLEQTIRTRVMNPGEDEIYVPNSEGVIINEEKVKKIIYEALFVDNQSVLKKMFPPIHPNKFYHHMTIEFAPKELKLPDDIGMKIKLPIIGRLTTDKIDTVLVESNLSTKKYPHITLSTAEGIKPNESDKALIEFNDQIEYFESPMYIDVTYGYFDGKEVR